MQILSLFSGRCAVAWARKARPTEARTRLWMRFQEKQPQNQPVRRLCITSDCWESSSREELLVDGEGLIEDRTSARERDHARENLSTHDDIHRAPLVLTTNQRPGMEAHLGNTQIGELLFEAGKRHSQAARLIVKDARDDVEARRLAG